MAIDRAERARRRWRRRAASRTAAVAGTKRAVAGPMLGVDGLLNSGARHQLAEMQRVEVVTEDDREASAGGGPLDLHSGVVRLTSRESHERE